MIFKWEGGIWDTAKIESIFLFIVDDDGSVDEMIFFSASTKRIAINRMKLMQKITSLFLSFFTASSPMSDEEKL